MEHLLGQLPGGGSFRTKEPREICGRGYAVKTLEAALWAFHRSGSFRESLLQVVNLGEDADTTGAVFGPIAGACHGEAGIPVKWRAKLAKYDLIRSFADRLFEERT